MLLVNSTSSSSSWFDRESRVKLSNQSSRIDIWFCLRFLYSSRERRNNKLSKLMSPM